MLILFTFLHKKCYNQYRFLYLFKRATAKNLRDEYKYNCEYTHNYMYASTHPQTYENIYTYTQGDRKQ